MSEAGQFAMMLASGAVGVTFIIVVLHPLVNAFADRLRGKTGGAVQDLDERLTRLEELGLGGDHMASSQRLAELEERLDFTERMLAQRADLLAPAASERQQER